MNINSQKLDLLKELEKQTFRVSHSDLLDSIKEQTLYKISFIKQYMELATLVHIHRPEIENIVFIDSMCNAGIYQNGYLCSAMEILLVFQDIIKAYNPTQKFHMILNDKNSARIDSTKWIFEKLINPENRGRIILHTSTYDVNCFLESPILQKHGISVHNRNTAITLFVDPYNFSTANIGSIKKFCNDNYADLFFNLFTSDFNRNKRIYKDKIDQLHLAKDSSIEELVDSIIKELKHTRNIKYCFDYKFMTSTNVELYRIVFATPHKKGLEKIKEVLWKIFDSNAYKNSRQETKGQLSLFDEDEIKESNKSYYAEEARNLLQQHFAGKNAKYDDIELFIMENTILAADDVIQFVLTPMIQNGSLIKKNETQNKHNYKKDTYYIKKEI